MDFKTFATDEKKEEQGVVIPLGPKSWIRVARIGNRNFRDKSKIKMQPYETLARIGKVPEEIQEQIVRELIAETVLLDWGGFTEDGKEIAYSYDNALRALTENKDFFAFVAECGNSSDNFRPSKSDTEKN
jgi:hypothetical protein